MINIEYMIGFCYGTLDSRYAGFSIVTRKNNYFLNPTKTFKEELLDIEILSSIYK